MSLIIKYWEIISSVYLILFNFFVIPLSHNAFHFEIFLKDLFLKSNFAYISILISIASELIIAEIRQTLHFEL